MTWAVSLIRRCFVSKAKVEAGNTSASLSKAWDEAEAKRRAYRDLATKLYQQGEGIKADFALDCSIAWKNRCDLLGDQIMPWRH